MVSAILVVGIVAVAYVVWSNAFGLWQNIRKARQIGLPYIVIPSVPYNMAPQNKILVPLLQLLPKRLTENWLFVLLPDWGYVDGQKHFNRLGNDSFVTVSPGSITLFTQSPEAIHQVASRREQFPKATQFYSVLEIFGRNILTTEGSLWRFHRKTTSASFNEKNAAHTFGEAIHQTQGLINKWNADGHYGGNTIRSIQDDTMSLALNIIGYVGFGLRFLWPGETLPPDSDPRARKYGSLTPPAGHSMTFAKSVEMTLERIVLLLMLPQWLLRRLGGVFPKCVEAYEARENYDLYMQEFLSDKAEAVRAGDRGEGSMDIMGQLVRSREQTGKSKKGSGDVLSDSEIIGNAFIMLVAGHETTANSMHFVLIEIANNPATQRALQADIDRLLGRDSDPATWRYDAVINAMQASMMGACMYEMLRMMPPVVLIPKWVAPPSSQDLVQDGRTYTLPPGIAIQLSAVTVQRHPKYWPTQPSKLTGGPSNLDDFVPERWFQKEDEGEDSEKSENQEKNERSEKQEKNERSEKQEKNELDSDDGYQGPDISTQLFRPVRGSFLPFSDGPRSCLGRRIAQVEMLAALAVVFQKYSLELAVDEFLPVGTTVDTLGVEERRTAYRQAQKKSRETLRGARSLLTLKLHGEESVPVRLVERGKERFINIVDVDE